MNKFPHFEVVADEHRKHPEVSIQLPMRADPQSMGYDFFSPEDVTIDPGETKMIWTDVKAFMPKVRNSSLPYCVMGLIVNTRSSMGKKGIVLANSQGWVDGSYFGNPSNDGNIGLLLKNTGELPYHILAGDKIAQGAFILCPTSGEGEQFQKTERTGGFGSSGK